MSTKSKLADKKKYRLIIDGIQICDGERIENRLDTMALYYTSREKAYIFYEEYQDDGSVLACRLIITPEEIELKKTGNGTSILRFRKNTLQECRYQSPMGELSLLSDTKDLKARYSGGDQPKVRADLAYALFMGGNLMSDYELHIQLN